MYYIRADANDKIGTGHIMRCLSIAEEFRRRGKNVTFIIADDNSRTMIEEHGFSVICLNSVWNDLDSEIDLLIQMIRSCHIEHLLIDSYFVTEKYLRAVREYTQLIYLDDLNAFLYPVDLLINYNIYAPALHYKETYQKAGIKTEFILGSQYVPLREEFSNTKRMINEKVSRILITSGGTDHYGMIEKFLYALQNRPYFENLEYYIILGKFNVHAERIKEHWDVYPNIHLFNNVKNISHYMTICDLAVTAGGSTVYELCACGIPSIIYTQADNQHGIAKTMSDLGLIPWAGDIRTDIDQCINSILQNIERYCPDMNIRKQISEKMRKAIDGRGCIRLVDHLLERK